MISQRELGWLAGIVEGEGCITKDLGLHIAMTDKDVMERVAAILERPLYTGRRNTNWPEHYKEVYKVQAHGPTAAGWLMTLYPLLGIRRQEAIRVALIRWRSIPIRKANGAFRAAACHPERMYCAKGLCEICYKGSQYYVHRKVDNPRKESYNE